MTRKDIEAEYKVVNGIIVSPGKFEGEPVFAPWFYEGFLEGTADEDDDGTLYWLLDEGDRREFPILRNCQHVYMDIDDQGFVRCWAVDDKGIVRA